MTDHASHFPSGAGITEQPGPLASPNSLVLSLKPRRIWISLRRCNIFGGRCRFPHGTFSSCPHHPLLRPMDLDIRTVLRWLIVGVIALLGLSLLGLLIDVIRPLLQLVLKAGAIVLVVLLIIRALEGARS